MAIVDQASEGGVRRRASGPLTTPIRPGFFRRRIGKYIALSQYGFPFSWGASPTPVARFRALARSARFAGHGGLTVLAHAAMTLAWPFGAALTAVKTIRRTRHNGKTSHGARVFFDMYESPYSTIFLRSNTHSIACQTRNAARACTSTSTGMMFRG